MMATACAALCANPACAAELFGAAPDCVSVCKRSYCPYSLGVCASQWYDAFTCVAAVPGCAGAPCTTQGVAALDCCNADPTGCEPMTADAGGATDGG
jgi:hypothetical protein